jgi:hypothetical protein
MTALFAASQPAMFKDANLHVCPEPKERRDLPRRAHSKDGSEKAAAIFQTTPAFLSLWDESKQR